MRDNERLPWRMVFAALALIGLSLPRAEAAEGAAQLLATLALDADSYALGQPIFFILTLENKGPSAIEAHLTRGEWDSFKLEMAFGTEGFTEVRFRLVMNSGPMPARRQFVPGEMLGYSAPVMCRGGGAGRGRANEEGADLALWLVCNRSGAYRVRAKIPVTVSQDKGFYVYSNEVPFKVTAPQQGYTAFVQFAISECRNANLELGKAGYARAQTILPALEGTVYGQYLKWAMMMHYTDTSLLGDEAATPLSGEAKARAEHFRAFAEQVIAKPREKWTRFEEGALEYLARYHWREGRKQEALKYARLAAEKYRWSTRNAKTARAIEEAAKEQHSGATGTEAPPSRGEGVTVVKPKPDERTGDGSVPPKGDSSDGPTEPPGARP